MSGCFPDASPGDCTVLVGIPTTESGYIAARAQHAKVSNGFVSTLHAGGLLAYREEVIGPFGHANEIWRRWGVDVQTTLTRSRLSAALQSPDRHVMIVLSHYVEGHLELDDGMLPDDELVALLPPGYRGLLDLCACKPMRLVSRIKHKAPGCSVCFASDELTPLAWFGFYSRLFHGLRKEPMSYVQAMERTCLLLGRRLSCQ